MKSWCRRGYRPQPFSVICATAAAVAAAAPLLAGSGCRKSSSPSPGSSDYAPIVRAFYTGLIAMQVGEDVRADKNLTEASKLAPQEPAIWADLALFRLRQGNLPEAAAALAKARPLAPENSAIALLSGIVESREGKFDQAIAYFRSAAELDPQNLRARYALAQTADRQGSGTAADSEFESQMTKILEARPQNQFALLESARVAARRGDAATLKERLDRLAAPAKGWPAETRTQFAAVRTAASGPNPRTAAVEIARLRNVLNRLPEFRADVQALELPDKDVAPPIERFLKLPSPPVTPAAPDTGLTFALLPLSGANTRAARALPLDETGATAVFATDGQTVKRIDSGGTAGASLPFPGGNAASASLGPNALLPLDWNNDYKTDMALAGPGGLRLFRQSAKGIFSDVTAAAKLPANITGGAYTGAWAADIEADGDLDIVLGAQKGSPTVLRNNADGTFAPLTPFTGVTGLRGFAWADVDGEGVPDAALIDGEGKLQVFRNERSGQFRKREVPALPGTAQAVAVAEANGDGLLDFIVWNDGGKVVALCDKGDEAAAWNTVPLLETALKSDGSNGSSAPHLLAADMDSNGGVDYVLSAGSKSEVWLSDSKNALTRLTLLDWAAQSVAFPGESGPLTLVGVAAGGKPVQAQAKGSKGYGWQVIRPHAADNAGDQRINSFGVGGEVEVRSGLLYQKMPITGPWIHFGMGEQKQAEYARIIWPNGAVQGEFDLKANQPMVATQRLKGSCPFLFAWNGKEMAFVTDCIWRSPLGLRINAQDTAGVAMTEDRVKLRADQLMPRNGFYDLSVTAELWETHYFDHLSLMAVDHPIGTEIFVDERFAIPPPPLEIHAFAPPRPVVSAHDDAGNDVTSTVRIRDGSSVDTFGRGRYQGITRSHYLEIDMGKDVPRGKPVYLIANGWIHPTDSSINVAIAQGNNVKPSGMSLEVPDGRGGWRVAKPALGFPSGKVKTVLLRVDDILPPGEPHKVRLRTNLEIYWDQIQWAERLPGTPLREQRLKATTADLRYRGFSVVKAKDASSPELPQEYDRLQGTAPVWRDLVGYHTRFGDVRELTAGVDDRYVIMNAGDELRLQFPALPPPPPGWKRDFVMVSDGWEKDGDYNTAFSRTVLPLPSHDNPAYDRPPARLEDDPMYQKYPQDWQRYHTRYVTPRDFVHALRPSN